MAKKLKEVLNMLQHKGGCGKSTISNFIGHILAAPLAKEDVKISIKAFEENHDAVENIENIGEYYQRIGSKVLFVDLDFQGDLTGYVLGDDIEPKTGVVEAILEGDATNHIIQSPYIENVYILPSVEDSVSGFERYFYTQLEGKVDNPYNLLEKALERFVEENEIEYIIIDNPPSLLQLMYFGMAVNLGCESGKTKAILPLQLDGRSTKSFNKMTKTIAFVKDNINPKIELSKVVPVLFDTRASYDKEIVERFREALGDIVVKTPIKRKTKIKEMTVYGFNESSRQVQEDLMMFYDLMKELGLYERGSLI